MDQIGQRVKKIRKDRKLTQKDFSNSLKIKQATLSQVENDVIKPSLAMLHSISNEFGISLDWLITGERIVNYNMKIGNRNNYDSFERNVDLLNKIYQRLIDVRLMRGKIENNNPESKLNDFIDEFAKVRNKYNDDLFLLKSGRPMFGEGGVNIEKMTIEDRNSYFSILENQVNHFTTTFFNEFVVFYKKYMLDWRKNKL